MIKNMSRNLPTKILMAFAVATSIVVESNLAFAKAPTAKALLWEISGNGLRKSSYLFGTVHIGCTSRLALSPIQQAALNKVQQLYREIDPEDKNNRQPPAKIPGGKTLKDLMTTSEYQKVEDYFGRYSLEKNKMNEIRPFLLSGIAGSQIGEINARKMCKNITAKEEILGEFATKYKIPIGGIETKKDRDNVARNIPLQDEVKDLLDTISYKSFDVSIEKDLANFYALYANQDIDAIITEELKQNIPSIANVRNERNRMWADRMSEIMPQKSTFFAFGVNHLGGKNGVISLLESLGYTLRPVFDTKSNQKPGMTAIEYFESGRDKENDREILDAIDDYTKAISLNPQYAMAHTNRGVLRKNNLNDPPGALLDFNRAITINPQSLGAYYQRSFLRSRNFNDYKGAVADLSQIILLDPNSLTPYYERGLLRGEKLNDFQGALADFNLAISLDPQNANCYLARGMLKYRKLNDQSGGIADVRRSIRLAKIQDNAQTLEKARIALRFMEANEEPFP
jgi:uncharacterized protein YbaP (TraB family)